MGKVFIIQHNGGKGREGTGAHDISGCHWGCFTMQDISIISNHAIFPLTTKGWIQGIPLWFFGCEFEMNALMVL
jgi:hypothetical protein